MTVELVARDHRFDLVQIDKAVHEPPTIVVPVMQYLVSDLSRRDRRRSSGYRSRDHVRFLCFSSSFLLSYFFFHSLVDAR